MAMAVYIDVMVVLRVGGSAGVIGAFRREGDIRFSELGTVCDTGDRELL